VTHCDAVFARDAADFANRESNQLLARGTHQNGHSTFGLTPHSKAEMETSNNVVFAVG
jgi:hypothetical protein